MSLTSKKPIDLFSVDGENGEYKDAAHLKMKRPLTALNAASRSMSKIERKKSADFGCWGDFLSYVIGRCELLVRGFLSFESGEGPVSLAKGPETQ